MKYMLFCFLISFSHVSAALSQIEGKDLASLKNFSVDVTKAKKGTVVVFLSSKCPCSNSHVKELKALAEKYQPEFVFVGIHSNSDEEQIPSQQYFQNAALNFSVVRDVKSAYANELKANKTPHAFILSPEGKIIYRGGVTNSSDAGQATKLYLREAIEDLSAGKTLRNSETRTLGCAISREGSSGWQ